MTFLIFSSTANGFQGSVELIKAELGKLLWKAVDDENIPESKEMLTNCGAYVDETSQLEGYEGTSRDGILYEKGLRVVVGKGYFPGRVCPIHLFRQCK